MRITYPNVRHMRVMVGNEHTRNYVVHTYTHRREKYDTNYK